jgi:hypothetical protein
MTDIKSLLRDADPVRHEDGLSSDDAQSIRREMLAALADAPVAVPAWRRPLTLAAAAALIFGVSGVMGHRSSWNVESSREPVFAGADDDASGSVDRRQLQFATPGGTRIIWIFDQNLRLQESMP